MAFGANAVTGKGASLTLDGNVVAVTSIKPKTNAEWADATDSSFFVAATNTLYKGQKKGAVQLELAIEGNFDPTTTNAEIFTQIITGQGTHTAVVNSAASTKYADGTFDIIEGDANLSVPGATMASFTCTIRSNGLFTLY